MTDLQDTTLFNYDEWLEDITNELDSEDNRLENDGYPEFGELSSAHSKRSREAMRDYNSY